MFFGTYKHSLDTKGRIIIPANCRDELGSQFLLMRGIEECLYVYPGTEMQKFEAQFATIPRTDRNGQAFIRMFMSSMSVCDFDNQGRIGIPADLREYAGLKKDAVVIGAYTRLEIWSADKWQQYSAEMQDRDTLDKILADVTSKTE